MKKNTFSEVVKPILVLGSICLVVTALLAYVNLITAPIIKAADDKAAAEARAEVLSEADGFETIDAKLPDEVKEAFKAKNDTGYVFKLSVKGAGDNAVVSYSSGNSSVASVTSDGTVKAVGNGNTDITVTVTENGETSTLKCKVYVVN